MLVPGLGCSSSISRVPKPPVLVKVDEKMATAAQESFRAALTSTWIDEDGDDGEDTDGPDDGLTIRNHKAPNHHPHPAHLGKLLTPETAHAFMTRSPLAGTSPL